MFFSTTLVTRADFLADISSRNSDWSKEDGDTEDKDAEVKTEEDTAEEMDSALGTISSDAASAPRENRLSR